MVKKFGLPLVALVAGVVGLVPGQGKCMSFGGRISAGISQSMIRNSLNIPSAQIKIVQDYQTKYLRGLLAAMGKTKAGHDWFVSLNVNYSEPLGTDKDVVSYESNIYEESAQLRLGTAVDYSFFTVFPYWEAYGAHISETYLRYWPWGGDLKIKRDEFGVGFGVQVAFENNAYVNISYLPAVFGKRKCLGVDNNVMLQKVDVELAVPIPKTAVSLEVGYNKVHGDGYKNENIYAGLGVTF